MNIMDTELARNNDDTMYIAFDDLVQVSDVHRRMAECRDTSIWTRDFIPLQYFEMCSALSKHASELRMKDKMIKTR